MRQGRSISDLAMELDRQHKAKADYVLETPQIRLRPGEGSNKGQVEISTPAIPTAVITEHCHRQIADRLKIPGTYYNRLRAKHPDLLCDNVNALFTREPERRMLRTLDGKARALLSDRYRRIDNIQLVQAVLPTIAGLGDAVEIGSCEVTETRLHLKVLFKDVAGWVDYQKPGKHVRVRQEVRSGFALFNSEVGLGRYTVQPFAEVLVCTNGLIIDEYATAKTHLGRRVESNDDEGTLEIWSQETHQVDDKLLTLKLRDTIHAMATQEKFDVVVDRMNQQADKEVTSDPQKAVEALASEFLLNETEGASILRHLIQGGDLSRWGYINAVTRVAQDAATYDRATELETIGGKLLAGDDARWASIDLN